MNNKNIMTSMRNVPSYNFETNIGHKCNMRCKFCFEQENGYPSISATSEMLSWFADYMLYMKNKTKCSVSTTIFGGEPFVHIDTLVPYIEKLSSFVEGAVIVTNGLQVSKYADEILYMKKLIPSLEIYVSYNFSLQDETRQEGTYEKVRDSIRWLCSKGFYVNSPVVFTPSNIHRIGEVFDDFMKLRKETNGRNRATYNYFKDDMPYSVVKEDILREELKRIQQVFYDEGIEKFHFQFRYSMIGVERGDHRRDCLFAAVPAALSPDGNIYPGYDVCHDNDFIKNLLRFGKVGDDFEAIDKKRFELVRTLSVEPPKQCRSCPSQCRVIPWRTMVDDASQFNGMPHPERCKVVNIIGEYLPVSGVLK